MHQSALSALRKARRHSFVHARDPELSFCVVSNRRVVDMDASCYAGEHGGRSTVKLQQVCQFNVPSLHYPEWILGGDEGDGLRVNAHRCRISSVVSGLAESPRPIGATS